MSQRLFANATGDFSFYEMFSRSCSHRLPLLQWQGASSPTQLVHVACLRLRLAGAAACQGAPARQQGVPDAPWR